MKIKKDVQKKIDEFARKQLLHLNATTFPFEVIGCIDDFRNDLSWHNIINDELEEDELTQSKKLLMEGEFYLKYPQNIAKFSAGYFGTEPIYVTNMKTGDGIIFIGQANNIYAAKIVFDCLLEIAAVMYKLYMEKLKRYKKQSTKEERADEYMDEWFEYLTERVRYNRWYDISCREYFADYIKQNFKTVEDQRRIMLRAIEIIKPMYTTKPDPSLTLSEYKKEIFKIFPEKDIEKNFKELNALQTQDIILFDYVDDIEDDK